MLTVTARSTGSRARLILLADCSLGSDYAGVGPRSAHLGPVTPWGGASFFGSNAHSQGFGNPCVNSGWLDRCVSTAVRATRPLTEKLQPGAANKVKLYPPKAMAGFSGQRGSAAQPGIPLSTLDSKIKALFRRSDPMMTPEILEIFDFS